VAAGGNFFGRHETAILGEVTAFAMPFVPGGYLAANGRILNISEYQGLFAKFGNTYGGEFSQGTFALPDLRGRTSVGSGFFGVTTYGIGQRLGSNRTTLTADNLPEHRHTLPAEAVDALPEPATWAMLLLGFGVVGAGLRSRRRDTAVTYA